MQNNIQRRIGGLEAMVSSNRNGIQEVKQSIKDLQVSSIETQKLVIANGQNVRHAVKKLGEMEQSLADQKGVSERKVIVVEKRVDNLEKLVAKVTGGVVVLVCLLNAPWEWLTKILRAAE